ncbi:hypothetical protein ACH36K_00375 [Clostridium sp. MB05]|uniref:hypothetical protein n=1 Tax=Clostridium sp. MB05 TaxID=3376682 RepID=UPI003982417C
MIFYEIEREYCLLYSELIKSLKANNVPINNIEFKPVKELIMINKHGGLIKLKEEISNLYMFTFLILSAI